jgi:hypothetical protein
MSGPAGLRHNHQSRGEQQVKTTTSYENKALQVRDNKALKVDLENKAADMPSYRCPTGRENAEVRVRKIDDGPLPMLDIREFRRSPADLSNEMHPTAHGVVIQAQYAEHLIEQIKAAIGAEERAAA